MCAIAWGLRQCHAVTEASSQEGKKLKLGKTRSHCVNPALTASPRQQDLILGKKDFGPYFLTQPQKCQVPL